MVQKPLGMAFNSITSAQSQKKQTLMFRERSVQDIRKRSSALADDPYETGRKLESAMVRNESILLSENKPILHS
jgi:hypothetical protein